jgi:hypothetical protein
MTKQRFLWWAVPVFLLVLAATVLVYRDLPATIPTHWDAAGQVNGHGPRATIFLEPLIIGLMVLLWPGLPRVSPDKFRVEGFSDTWWFSGLVVVGLLAYVQCILLAVLSTERWISAAPCSAASASPSSCWGMCWARSSATSGSACARRGPWPATGSGMRRTGWPARPWSRADWWWWLATLLGLPGYVATAALLAGALVPVVYSLVYYKRLEGGA